MGAQINEQEAGSAPTLVVERFLELLCSGDIDGAVELMAVDVEYKNVGLPMVRGRERTRRLFHATLGRPGAGFEVYVHAISADGGTVLTERTDVLAFGRLRVQFWVCGRFDVRDAQIVLWRDYFDQMNIAAATIRGLLGTVFPAVRAKPSPALAGEHVRPIRALAARTGRRALAAMVRGQNDEALERRFAEPSRQRALLRAMVCGFQPAHSGGFRGVIAYELEPFVIEPPPEAPWRWAIEVDSKAGRARLLEPAPLEAALTIHAGLAEWVRVSAGVQNAVTAMTGGRFNVKGDIILATRLEAMFGAR